MGITDEIFKVEGFKSYILARFGLKKKYISHLFAWFYKSLSRYNLVHVTQNLLIIVQTYQMLHICAENKV